MFPQRRLRRRPPPPRGGGAAAPAAVPSIPEILLLLLILLPCGPAPCGASSPPPSIPEVRGVLLAPSSEARSLLPGRRRGGRAELLTRDSDGCGDPPESTLPPGPRPISPEGAVWPDPPRTLGWAPGDRLGGGPDEIDLALPSFDSPDACGGGGGGRLSGPVLSELLTRPPGHVRLPRDVSPTREPPPSASGSGLGADPPPRPLSPRFRKTGTTIAGCLCEGGTAVVIGADTRATDGTVVADKACEKVHRLADNVWCCGAGTSGDIDALVRRVRYNFLLRGMLSDSVGNGIDADGEGGDGAAPGWGRSIEGEQGEEWLPPASVSAVCRYIRDRLYGAGGSIGANLVLGGYAPHTGHAVLTAIHPHGSMDVVPYTALGSGGLAATAVLEGRYPPDRSITLEDAVRLVKDAVGAGISNDMGSGSQVDLCIMSQQGVEYRRAVVGEETLPTTGDDEAMEGRLRVRHTGADGGEGGKEGEVIMNGVNGFGSLPYFVKSRRVVAESEEVVEEDRQRWLEEALGLGVGGEDGPGWGAAL